MKKKYMSVTLGLFSFLLLPFSTVAAQSDLTLQDELTTEYIAYLSTQETTWQAQVAIGGDDAATMKAHLGLALLAFEWSHVDGDTMVNDLEPFMDAVSDDLANLIMDTFDAILPILFAPDQDSMFTELTRFFNSGDYVALRDSVSQYLDDIDANFGEGWSVIEDWFTDVEENFSDENFYSHIDSVRAGTADFQFDLQVLGSGYDDTLFVFDRTFFNRWDSLDAIGELMGESFETAAEMFDSIMADIDADVSPAVAEFRLGLSYLTEAVDTLKVILVNDPFSPFEIDVSGLDSLQDAIAELDTLLGGKIYDIGPDEENKTIKPLAILENMPGDGLWDLLMDFYRAPNPTAYTFNGIFPVGPPSDILVYMEADAVLNSDDDDDMLYDRLQTLDSLWLNDLALDPEDPDAHFGLALAEAYKMIYDHSKVYEDVFRLLEKGRVDSLDFLYDWKDLDISDELDSIANHLDVYSKAFDEPTNFVILIKTADDGLGRYEIGPETEFEWVQISIMDATGMRIMLEPARGAVTLIVGALTGIASEITDIFIFDLDPTVLDFSQVENDSDLVLLLESSNPDFLTLTPYGIERFDSAGEDLEQGFRELGEFFDNMTLLAYAMAPFEADFDMDGQMFIDDMESASDAAWEIHTDFAFPDSTIEMDGERVNLSAWFDDPPTSFLVMWKNFVFGIDSTLGGLFPDRYKAIIGSDEIPGQPSRFALHPNYPNPFNPATSFLFDIPAPGHVTLIIYDLLGNEVTRLVDTDMNPGTKLVRWNARDLSSGIYFARLEYAGRHLTRKLLLMK
ncbi:MAG: T9SS type A sorting domain-containing protein [Fidelibacterota bacterium]|nr:MAG: T9SS type A sorting domain-containing protein [Candidatus Neomarinimicrobiota bacterium]